jgi:hypothetical protein
LAFCSFLTILANNFSPLNRALYGYQYLVIEKNMENTTGAKIISALNGMNVNNIDRDKFSIMLNDVVFDNQRAIFDLVKLGHLGSASALLRVIFEAHVKAIWIYSCASDKQISQFEKDKVKSRVKPKDNIQFQEMITDIEAEMPYYNGNLSKFKQDHWKGLNSLTHSGIMQFSYQFKDGVMSKKHQANYSKTLLEFSERFAILSLGNVGKIVGDIEIVKTHIELAKERLGM